MFSSVDELCRSMPKFSRLSVYTKPNIPKQKLVNAIKSYGKTFVKHDDILVLVDDTVFGSAKDGFFLTKTHFFANGISGFIDANIGEVYTVDAAFTTKLCIEDTEDGECDWQMEFPTGSKNDIYLFRDYLDECLSTLVFLKERTEKQEQTKLEHKEKLEEERQQQLVIQDKELERQKKINAIYQDTSDEILTRVNKLFEMISDIDKLFKALGTFVFFLKNRIISSDCIEKIGKEEVAAYYCIIMSYKIINNYKTLVEEYNKMRAISEIIEKNRDIIVDRLDIASEYVNDYKKIEEFAYNNLSDILVSFDKSILDNENAGDILLSMDWKEEITEAGKETFVYQSPPEKKDIDDINQISNVNHSANGEEQNTLLSNFFANNSDSIVSRLKASGLQISAVALQNDENIERVAGVIHNLLPAAIRFFVSYNTVENFLLNNRQWLINRLTN